MNAVKDLNVHVIYDSTKYLQVMGAAIVKEAGRADVTLHNVSAMTSTALTAELATIESESADKIYVLTDIQDTYSTAGQLTYDMVAGLRAKLAEPSDEAIEEGTCVTGSTSTIGLEDTESVSTANDYYNNLFLVSSGDGAGGSNDVKLILDYTGATRIAEVGGAAWTNPADDTEYAIYDETNIIIPKAPALSAPAAYLYLGATDVLKGEAYRVWEKTRPTNIPPQVVRCLGLYQWYLHTGTSTSGNTTTLTNSGASFGTSDALVGKYVFCVSGAGIGQYAKIKSHTNTALTIEDAMKYPLEAVAQTWTSPGNNTVYYVVDDINKVFVNIGMQYAIGAYLFNLTDGAMWEGWQAMLNDYENNGLYWDNNADYESLPQSDDVFDYYVGLGKSILAGKIAGL